MDASRGPQSPQSSSPDEGNVQTRSEDKAHQNHHEEQRRRRTRVLETATDVRMAGYLEKRGRRRLVATWRRYWFVLQGRLLLYYRSDLDYLGLASCRGSLNLGLASAVRPGSSAAAGVIEVVTRTQVVTLRARDKSLRERWLAALLEAVSGGPAPALGAGPLHFRYSLDHLPTSQTDVADRRSRSCSLEAVSRPAYEMVQNALYAAGEQPSHDYEEAPLTPAVTPAEEDDDEDYYYSSYQRVATAEEVGEPALPPRPAAAAPASPAPTPATIPAPLPAPKKRRRLQLRLKSRAADTPSASAKPKRRISFLERVLTSVRGIAATAVPTAASASSAACEDASSDSEPEYETVSGFAEHDRHTVAPPPRPERPENKEDKEAKERQQPAAMAKERPENGTETSTPAETSDEPTVTDAGVAGEVEEAPPAPITNGRETTKHSKEEREEKEEEEENGEEDAEQRPVQGVFGSASLLPRPALAELRERLRMRAEHDGPRSLTLEMDRARDRTGDEDAGDGQGFAALQRRWRNREGPSGPSPQRPVSPVSAGPPPLPRKQSRTSSGGQSEVEADPKPASVRQMATQFEAAAAAAANQGARHSDELSTLLAQLAELTAAPLRPSRAHTQPPATTEDPPPPRRRRLSEPDYDIPRPHGSALQLAALVPAAAPISIDARPFFGGPSACDPTPSASDDPELSWSQLSMAPDSLEPVPPCLLDATS